MPTWRLKIYGRAPQTSHGRRKLTKGDVRVSGGILDALGEVERLLKDAPDADELLDRIVVQRHRV